MTTTTTTEAVTRPIIFSASMVRALLEGRKTMTRRIVAWSNSTCLGYPSKSYWPNLHFDHAEPRRTSLLAGMAGDFNDVHLAVPWRHPDDGHIWLEECGKYAIRPIWQPGDRLFVRECVWTHDAIPFNRLGSGRHFYDADLSDEQRKKRRAQGWRKRPSIHMHRGFSRITLEIDAVRVERAHSITDADVRAEGVDPVQIDKWRKWLDPRDVHGMAYGELFNSVNGKGAWAANPWVWVLSFHRVEAPRA